jgi:steroid 5-alpha reductase family enzyme
MPSFLEHYSGTSIVFLAAAASYYIHFEEHDAVTASFKMAAANAVFCLLFSWPTGDYSWVDRLWSVVPFIYAVHFAAAS